MLAGALSLHADRAGVAFTDGDQIAAWAKAAVDTMSALGVVSGADGGQFQPGRSISRGETMVILDQAVAGYYDRAGVYTQNETGAVTIIAAPGVTLRGVTIEGDLLVAPGAQGSETILNGVTVTGTLMVASGREAQVLVTGDSRLEAVEVSGEDARLQFGGDAQVGSLTVSGSGAHIRGLDEDLEVTVAEGAQDVLVNGHEVRPGTAPAGEDVSSDSDDLEIEIDVSDGNHSSGGGSHRPGGSGGSERPDEPDEPQEPEEDDGIRDEDEYGGNSISFDDLLGLG